MLLSHIPGLGLPLNTGVTAVIIFYFTSGLLMRRSYRRFTRMSSFPVRDFYVDRLLKLYPQYAVMVALSFSAIAMIGPAEHTLFMNQQADLTKVLLNLALLPANYVFEPLVIPGMLPHPIIPPAWSLAAEFHFYLLVPLLALLPRTVFLALCLITGSIQIGALFFVAGDYNSNNFGYRFIFGALVFFLFGCAQADKDDAFYRRVSLALWLVYAVMLFGIAPWFSLLANPQVKEVLLGAVLALPLVSAAMRCKPSPARWATVDNHLGRMAYPLFICHIFAFYLCERLWNISYDRPTLMIPVTLLVSLMVAQLLLTLQQLFDRYRLERRGFASMSQEPA
ncbi:acyltransferase family protein [Pseudomonas sp. QE6]|uniref:acyltransferase family protein n=1 Tax=Pseudomonas sp. QE6 TaxID=3242491 RepID=UPI003529BA4B